MAAAVAIFGNAHNDYGSGEASLFIVGREGGIDENRSAVDYRQIVTEVGDPGNRNGFAAPARADVDGNGTSDRVCAAQMAGIYSVPGYAAMTAAAGACRISGSAMSSSFRTRSSAASVRLRRRTAA